MIYQNENPRISISPGPQPLFGKVSSAETDGAPAPTPNVGTLIPSQYPDFARICICSGPDGFPGTGGISRLLCEAWEVKPLNCAAYWWTASAAITAGKEAPKHLSQVYTQAMAAFAHNSDWRTVHAILIVGVYFTYLVWDRRPADDVLAEEVIPVPLPKSQEYRRKISRHLGRIRMYEKRVLPSILYWNEPIFSFSEVEGRANFRTVSLTPAFLWTMAKPLRSMKNLVSNFKTSDWFNPPSTKPRIRPGVKVSPESARTILSLLSDNCYHECNDRRKLN